MEELIILFVSSFSPVYIKAKVPTGEFAFLTVSLPSISKLGQMHVFYWSLRKDMHDCRAVQEFYACVLESRATAVGKGSTKSSDQDDEFGPFLSQID